MSVSLNKGYNKDIIDEYRAEMAVEGKPFLFDDEDEQTDEYAHFFFIGKYQGKEVIYDAVLYTLRMHHESELYEIAEHRAAKHFPQYKKINYEEDENGNLAPLDELEEEIGLFIAEVMAELEEDESVKVKEHVQLDANVEFGVSLDIGLHVESVTTQVIEKFIREFNDDTLQLDPTMYSFQTEDEAVDE